MSFAIQPIDYASPAWEGLPASLREDIRKIVSALEKAPARGIVAWLRATAQQLGVSYATLRRHYYALAANGGDWAAIVDARRATTARAKTSLTGSLAFRAELVKMVEQHQRKNSTAFHALRRRWEQRRSPVPGYETWPGWPAIPSGWHPRNLARIVKQETNAARLRSIRVGTSSKTNPFLPTVLTTRVGLWPGAVVQLDDVWHDNYITVGKSRKPAKVLEIGALDLFSACRFHFGAKPRLRRGDGTWETIGGADMRLFLAGMFHRYGYSPRGTMLMSEHQTAKVSEDVARVLCDATRGMVRVSYQPIEGKQAALSGYWAGTEGGNFRAKACLEVTHGLIHNDLAALPLQSGSPSSGLLGPVTTARQIAYIERIVRDMLKKVPHRADLLRLPGLDFHYQFYPFLLDYYEFGLNSRTDHEMEGWAALGHVVAEYTALPGSGQFFGEEEFLALPEISQMALRSAIQADPERWTRRRNLSPKEVWNRREKALPVPPAVLCSMLGQDLARDIVARKGFLEFSDKEISAEPLIYSSRYISGPRAGQEIPHGEKVSMFALPFDTGVGLVQDAQGRYLGEVPLYRRVMPINPDAFGHCVPFEQQPDIRSEDLRRAAGEKHERIARILEPTRHLHRAEVAEARDLREHNRRVLSGRPVTDEEVAAAYRDAAVKGQRTRAAGRLQDRGSAVDWDADDAVPARTEPLPWAMLPDDEPVHDAL